MTLPPEKRGDRGQRYAVCLNGWPARGWQAIAYTDDLERAVAMAEPFRANPAAEAYRIVDRRDDDQSFTEMLRGEKTA